MPPTPQPSQSAAPGGAPARTPTSSGTATLHEHAVAAERHLEQLSTGLAQAGAEDQVVQTFTKMAEVTRKLVVVLGRGQEVSGDEEPPADEAVAPEPPSRPRTIQSETQRLHDEMRAKAQAGRTY